MKVLVTGGAGFIGSHVVDALIKRGYEVVVIDNLSTGFRENINPRARLYELDILDDKISEIISKEKPDIVNHHAAQISVANSVANPAYDATQNIVSSLKLLSKCIEYKINKFVFASSGGAIYGNPLYLPVDELHIKSPTSPYGIAKYAAENYISFFAREYGMKTAILRYSNVFGPRQNPEGEAGVIAIFTYKMLKNVHPVIFGKGDKTRDYIFVSDIVEANILAMENNINGIYNIGTGKETSDQEVFDTLARALNYQAKPVYGEVRKGEVYRICLNCEKAKRELGWQSGVNFKDGIDLTVDYLKKKFLKQEVL